MKKIGILTINDYNNYGNRLQNFAAQEVLKSFGFTVETIVNNTNHNNDTKISKVQKTLNEIQNLKSIPISEIYFKTFSKLRKFVLKKKLNKLRDKRYDAFKEFTTSNILETPYTISEDNIPNDLSSKYDYFITGSDQVWNPIFRGGSSIDFLTFAPNNKRIAYAPSFGISEIPTAYLEQYKVWLSELSGLSVREKAGARIINELTGKNATVLVDPTLMIGKEKWMSISKPAINKPKNRYLLTYFLGGIPVEYKSRIIGISKENDLQIINLADINDGETFVTGPSEFIDYINSASVFCTDSFHGVVFSILMGTPFIVFERMGSFQSMNSRIESLLTTFKLESRLSENIKNNNQVFEADYFHVGPILEFERKKALDYLEKFLNANDNNF